MVIAPVVVDHVNLIIVPIIRHGITVHRVHMIVNLCTAEILKLIVKVKIMSLYIGEKKIKGVLDQKDGTVKVGFKDNSPDIILGRGLYNLVKKSVKGKGDVTDTVRHLLATKFLMEMADYGLEFYMVEHISQGMATLAHNLREDLFSKTFDCVGMNGITINKLIGHAEEKEG